MAKTTTRAPAISEVCGRWRARPSDYLAAARDEPPIGAGQDEAIAAIEDFLESFGDTCPECSP